MDWAPKLWEVISDELGIDPLGTYHGDSKKIVSDELGIDPHGTYHDDSKDVISDEHGTDPTRHVPRRF